MTDPSQYFKGRTVQEQMNEVIGYVDVRSAEVATDAIAADVAQVHRDMLDADADATAAAASAAAAAGTLANAVKKTGEASQSIAGDIAVAGTLSGGVVTGTQVTVPAPVNNTDAATKKYVDDADALLVPIADINQHAVGLTGNQGPIAGVKDFLQIRAPVTEYFKLISNDGTWQKCFTFTAPATAATNFFILVNRANAYGSISQYLKARFSVGSGGSIYSTVYENGASDIHIGVARDNNVVTVSVKVDASVGRPFLVFIEKLVNQNGTIPTDVAIASGTASDDPTYVVDGA